MSLVRKLLQLLNLGVRVHLGVLELHLQSWDSLLKFTLWFRESIGQPLQSLLGVKVELFDLPGGLVHDLLVTDLSLSDFLVDDCFDECFLTFKLLTYQLILQIFILLDQVVHLLEANVLEPPVVLKKFLQLFLQLHAHALDAFLGGHFS